jgi:cyclophilin family peptidyl-prolyl cis-trans isomerase
VFSLYAKNLTLYLLVNLLMKTKSLPIYHVELAQHSKKLMKYFTAGLLLLFAATVYSKEMPIVSMQTNFGMIILELYPDKAPKTVENFLRYTQAGFYEGTIFHRVVKRFVIQGGGYTINYEKKPSIYPPIPNESQNGLKNRRGTIAMARRTDEENSATSQFFINVNDNDTLNYLASSYSYEGYTVFGKVIKGLDVVDKIQQIETGANGPLRRYVPQQMVIIEKVTVENIPTTKVQTSPTLITPSTETQEEESKAITEIQEDTDSPLTTKTPEKISTTTTSEESQKEPFLTETKPQQESSSMADTDTEEEPFSQSTKETETSTTAETNPNFLSTETQEETSSASDKDTESGLFSIFTRVNEEETLSPLATETPENISIIDRETETIDTETNDSPATSVVSLAADTETDTTSSTDATEAETETLVANREKETQQQASKATANESKTLLFPPDSPSQPDKPEALPD